MNEIDFENLVKDAIVLKDKKNFERNQQFYICMCLFSQKFCTYASIYDYLKIIEKELTEDYKKPAQITRSQFDEHNIIMQINKIQDKFFNYFTMGNGKYKKYYIKIIQDNKRSKHNEGENGCTLIILPREPGELTAVGKNQNDGNRTQIITKSTVISKSRIRYSKAKKEVSLKPLYQSRRSDNATKVTLHDRFLPAELIAKLTRLEEEDKESIRIEKLFMDVGRQEEDVDIVIEEDDTISRKHFNISYVQGEFMLRDLGSLNGTFLNDEPIEEKVVKVIKDGDIIKIGSTLLRFNIKKIERTEEKTTPENHSFWKYLKKLIAGWF